MGRRKERTPELRERVLRAAVALLEEGGAARFTARSVAAGAGTSTPAIYELFGDKAGLIQAVIVEGFRLLHQDLEALPVSADPRDDLETALGALRRFVTGHPALAQVMFSRPLADIDPPPESGPAGRAILQLVRARVRRCVAAGVIAGDQTDVAHGLIALAQGLAGAEANGGMGSSRASADRRWSITVRAVLNGLAPDRPPRLAAR
jgi:AcrR family transcriptional regulator